MPAAIAAIIAFVIALFAHLIGGKAGTYVTDAALVGFILLASAVAWPGWWGMRGPRA